MWVVERPRSSVFIFGETVGLREDDVWLTDVIRAAVEESREVWREADREEIERSPLIATYAVSNERLSERLDESERLVVEGIANEVGVDPAVLEVLRPWAAAQVLEGALRANAGIDATLAADEVITRLATDAGIVVRCELGDAEATLSWFAGMDRELEVDYLIWTVERISRGVRDMDRQVAAWVNGDLSVSEEQVAEMRRDHPQLHARMLVERNRAWVPRIQAMVDEPGRAFVLVGGAHLVGGDSILTMLAEAGLKPRRLT